MIEQFREKYGVKDVKRYDSKFEVAVINGDVLIEAFGQI